MVSLLEDDPLSDRPRSSFSAKRGSVTIFSNPTNENPLYKLDEEPEVFDPTEGIEERPVADHDIETAAAYVRDALHFRNVPFRPDKLLLYQIYQDPLTRWSFVLFPTIILALALVEDPAVPALDVHWQAVLVLELVCLVACTCRVIHLRLCLDREEFWRDIKNCTIVVSIGIMFLDMAVWFGFKTLRGESVLRASRILRPLLIINISENRNLRKLLRNIKRTVLDVFSVLVLIFLFIGIFAMMATKFFERRDLIAPNGDGGYLDNFGDSYWNLYILMTTANSPDVSLPAFQDEAAFFFFFAPFSVITTFILLNILLAVVYKHYRTHLLQEVRSDVRIIKENLRSAFALLARGNHIQRNVWEQSYRRMGCSDALQGLYWDYLVPDKNAPGITLPFFYKITDLLSSRIELVICKKVWLETVLPRLYNSTLSCYLRCAVDHISFTIFYDVLIFANAILLALKHYPPQLEETFLVLFNIEILLKVYTVGPSRFIRGAWNCYDCLVIWSATVFSVMVKLERLADSKDEELSNTFLDMVLTLRVLRLLKLLTSIPQLRLIVTTLAQIIPSMGSYALLLFLFYYSYAIVGMEVFGGLIQNVTDDFCGNPALNGSDFAREGYCSLTFNDVLYSFVVLWTLTLVNQWHVLAEGFVAVTSKWARLYFLSFHVVVVLIILNIFLAFVIEAFMMQIEMDKRETEGIEEHLDSRGMNARRESYPEQAAVWYRGGSTTSEENMKIFIGTCPLEGKVRYRRQNLTRNYNQLLLDMFQEEIPDEGEIPKGEEAELPNPAAGRKQQTSEADIRTPQAGVNAGRIEVEQRVVGGKMGDASLIVKFRHEQEEIVMDGISMGSLQDIDII